MPYEIEKRLIPGIVNIPLKEIRYVIAHESGNSKNVGPDALEREVSYMSNNWRKAFTSHWVGDGGRIIQIAPVNRLQYGCGSKGNPLSYAQVELVRTSDKEQFKKDYAAYIWLLRKLAKDAGIPVKLDYGGKGVKTHKWISDNLGGTDHTDPYSYLAAMGISAAQFRKDIENGIEEEDDDIMKFSNETTKNTVRDHIAQMVKKKYVDKSWLTKFDEGTMTNGDYDALCLIENQKKAAQK